jgi:folate-binding protein YgfZ
VLSFHGPDAVRFLNGQVTQDASRLGDRVLPSCVTDAKGRLQYLVDLCQGPDGESLWVICPSVHADGLRERLERYLIADDVEIEDLSGKWWRVHGATPNTDRDPAFVRSADGCFGEGFDAWWNSAPTLDCLDPAQQEDLRIAARIPAMGRELEPGMLPPEAGLDRVAISYTKGCYIGQEVLSRIKSAGKVNRRLAAFRVEGNGSAGDSLICGETAGGALTSVATGELPDGSRLALGYLGKKAFKDVEFRISPAEGAGTARREAWA